MRHSPKAPKGRAVKCSLHGKAFRGHGTSRVLRKIVFHFCGACWLKRGACEELMRKVAA